MAISSSPRFLAFLLAVSSLFVFATSFRRLGAIENKVHSFPASWIPAISHCSLIRQKRLSSIPYSSEDDEGSSFGGGDCNGTHVYNHTFN